MSLEINLDIKLSVFEFLAFCAHEMCFLLSWTSTVTVHPWASCLVIWVVICFDRETFVLDCFAFCYRTTLCSVQGIYSKALRNAMRDEVWCQPAPEGMWPGLGQDNATEKLLKNVAGCFGSTGILRMPRLAHRDHSLMASAVFSDTGL